MFGPSAPIEPSAPSAVRPSGGWNRRAFLALSVAATSALVAAPRRARAADGGSGDGAPTAYRNSGIYRFAVGDIEAFSISDGFGGAPDPTGFMSPESGHGAMIEALRDAYQPTDFIPFYFNVLVLRRGDDVILFDGGNGPGGMGTSGMLPGRLGELGILPGDVTAVFLSHAHPDHIGGLVADGAPVFPNAPVLVAAAERDFWTADAPDLSRSRIPDEMKTGMTRGAKAAFDALAGRIETITPGDRLFDCVTPILSPGHTPGHLTFRIESGGESLHHIVDLAHNPVLMFADPTWSIAFDTIPEQAVRTRVRMFRDLADDRVRVYGYHMPFPGVGHIAPRDNGFAWIPEPWWWASGGDGVT